MSLIPPMKEDPLMMRPDTTTGNTVLNRRTAGFRRPVDGGFSRSKRPAPKAYPQVRQGATSPPWNIRAIFV
jgi:hypothetical protein